jgi:hypothetical protein
VTTIDDHGLPPLRRRQFVPVDEVEPLLAGTRAQLVDLAAQLERAEADAQGVEASLGRAAVSPRAQHALDEAARAIESMRATTAQDAAATLQQARDGAAARLAEARAEAAAIRAPVRGALESDPDRHGPARFVPTRSADNENDGTPGPQAPASLEHLLAPIVIEDMPRREPARSAGLRWLPLEVVVPMVALIMAVIVVLAFLG